MNLTPQLRMDLRAAQQMVMTPQLQAAIQLLTMTNLELADYVEEQLASNPFLEKVEGSGSGTEAREDAPGSDLTAQPNDVRDAFSAAPETSVKAEPQVQDGVYDEGDNSRYDSDAYAGTGSGGSSDFSEDEREFDATLSKPVTLREHLNEQIAVTFTDPRDAALAGLLADALDESGYLRQDPSELAENLKVAPERLAHVLSTLKTLDPTGAFAHDLSECLELQLRDQGEWDEAWGRLLANLNLLAGHELKKLAQACGIDAEELKERVTHLKTLNPKPASSFEQLIVQTALPDVLMTRMPKSQGGGWRVEVNNDTLPKVLVNQRYVKEVEGSGGTNKETKTYVSQQIANANWLIKAMDQRAQTVLAVASAIVEAQDGFFLYGIEFLRTMTLKDVAEEIGVHESTVSRIVNGKFIATPRGLFELRFFFSSGVTNSDGQDVAAEAVKAKIKALIEAESPKDILSDDTLAELLNKDGINVARRTVAKYREAMGYPSSVLRRRQKNT